MERQICSANPEYRWAPQTINKDAVGTTNVIHLMLLLQQHNF